MNQHANKTHCKWGHEFTKENTSIYVGDSGPQRVCKTCRRDYNRKNNSKRLPKKSYYEGSTLVQRRGPHLLRKAPGNDGERPLDSSPTPAEASSPGKSRSSVSWTNPTARAKP